MLSRVKLGSGTMELLQRKICNTALDYFDECGPNLIFVRKEWSFAAIQSWRSLEAQAALY
jgi:hypothetical protein